MHRPSLSVCASDLRSDVREAMEAARRIGFHAIDVGASEGPISPGELSRSGQRHLLKHLSDLGLRLGSLRGPVGGEGIGDAVAGERRLDAIRGIARLASDLRVPVISAAIGGVRADATGEAEQGRVREALVTLADDADRLGVTVSLETAGIEAATLNRMLSEIGCPLLRACCDTGAMLMQGEDPHAVGELLAGRIGLVRARDAIAGSRNASGYEVALGQGQLDPARFLAALHEAGFQGDLVLSRSLGPQRAADLAQALKRWRELSLE